MRRGRPTAKFKMTDDQYFELGGIALALRDANKIGEKGAVIGDARIAEGEMVFSYVTEKWARRLQSIIDEMKTEELAEKLASEEPKG